MGATIDSFRVTNLHGYKSYEFSFPDNTIILVGENGSGKTTVLRLLYYLLSGQWNLLRSYKFEEISIAINGKEFKLNSKQIERSLEKLDDSYLRRLPPNARNKFLNLLRQGDKFAMSELRMLSDRYNIPLSYLHHQLSLFEFSEKDNSEINKLFLNINKSLNAQILYLPTYRRIEQELNLIFRGIDDDEWKRGRLDRGHRPESSQYVELIEFGMMDVVKLIKDTLERLKDFARENLNTLTLGYLGDVVDKKYAQVDINEIRQASEETIRSVLDRIHESILSKSHKEHLSSALMLFEPVPNLTNMPRSYVTTF